ncbi:hypothetical protein N8009_02370 [Flavobacteriaceae bacterium]|nr:hypothetical protein [Flavobacteriaceae bacterium]
MKMNDYKQEIVKIKLKDMKKILFIGCFLLTALSCKAQILPIEDLRGYMDIGEGIPENITYIKDVNNLLGKYEGVWIGIYNNKTFELHIEKETKIYYGTAEDLLLLRYKITDNSNNNIIFDNIDIYDDTNASIIKGYYMSSTGTYYVLNYPNPNAPCGLHGEIFIEVPNTSLNQMKLFLAVGYELLSPDDCPNGFLEQIFPTESSMTFTKQ